MKIFSSRMIKVKLSILVLCLICASVFASPARKPKEPSSKPHIVLFLADDLGWNDVGFHGMTQIPTPNIDALATDGVILNNYYTAPMCTPSRASLMTGYYSSTTGNQHNVLLHPQPAGLPLKFRTLPQALKNLGYTSHIIGKWHLGFFSKEYTPTFRGFESHYGFWGGGTDFFFHTFSVPPMTTNTTINVPYYEGRSKFVFSGLDFRDGLKTVTNRTGEYLTDIYTERAVQQIKAHDTSKPLFLFLSHHGVHRGSMEQPIRAPKKYTKDLNYIRDNDRRNFGGSLRAVDQSLGDVMEALEKKKMLNNTIFIFSTDNGAPKPGSYLGSRGSNFPLRGAKLSGFEGGTRGAAFIWSANMPNHKIFEGLMHISDWMPTLYEAAGGKVKDLGTTQGKSMWPSLLGKENSSRIDVLLISDPVFNMSSYRYGDYKLMSGSYPLDDIDGYYGDVGRERPPLNNSSSVSKVTLILQRFYGDEKVVDNRVTRILVNCGEKPTDLVYHCDLKKDLCLFNVKEDPCEYKNLAKTHPEILKTLVDKFKTLKKEMVRPWNPKFDYNANPVYHGGFWSPWIKKY